MAPRGGHRDGTHHRGNIRDRHWNGFHRHGDLGTGTGMSPITVGTLGTGTGTAATTPPGAGMMPVPVPVLVSVPVLPRGVTCAVEPGRGAAGGDSEGAGTAKGPVAVTGLVLGRDQQPPRNEVLGGRDTVTPLGRVLPPRPPGPPQPITPTATTAATSPSPTQHHGHYQSTAPSPLRPPPRCRPRPLTSTRVWAQVAGREKRRRSKVTK